jgi:hypothetical protein
MEFIEGESLTDVVKANGALPPRRAADISRQAAEGLSVAHVMGIVHRDLKPDNIMIAKNRDGSDCVKVVDFGIAKAAGNDAQKVTKTGLVVGTPEYMSPEQLAGDKLDGRSDIYSLGLVAFNMLTGKLPFPSESAQESMIMRLTDKPKPLAEMKPDMPWPADVQAVMDKALERDMNARYQNAIEFGMALYNAVNRMPETQAMELGTAVMNAVPATRVAPVASPAAATVAVPAAPVSAPVTQTAAPERKKSNVGMLVGAAAAVVIVGGLAFKMMSGPKTEAPAQTQPNTVAPAGNPTPTTQSPTSAQQTTQPLAKPADNTADGSSKTKAAPQKKNVADDLRKLIDASQDPKQAAFVTNKVDELAPNPSTSEELYLTTFLKGNVLVAKGGDANVATACDRMKAILSKLSEKDQRQATGRMTVWQCPD